MTYSKANCNPLIKKLVDEGVLPQMCIRFSIDAQVNEPVRITTESWLTDEQFQTIAEALLKNPEEAKRIARTMIFKSMDDSNQSPISVNL